MHRRNLLIVISLLLIPALGGLALAVDVGALIKVFGVGYVVHMFADQLNALINTLTFNHGFEGQQATKVVPIVSMGSGLHIGAAQVAGDPEAVAQVAAVGQLEGTFIDGAFRAKALVPIDNLNPLAGVKRVFGVGISAVIDIRADGGGSATSPSEETEKLTAEPWEHVLYLGRKLTINGNNNLIRGDVNSPELAVAGNNNELDGKVAGKLTLKGKSNKAGVKVGEAGPGYRLDWARLKGKAKRTVKGGAKLADETINGVLYVRGDATITGPLKGKGAVVAEGKITLQAGRKGTIGGDVFLIAREKVVIKGNNGRIQGFFAGPMTVQIDGNSNRIYGLMVADSVLLQGNNNELVYREPERSLVELVFQ
jgi:predicted acyltransferase (DUF342 family)